MHPFKVCNLISLDICICQWSLYYNQDTKHSCEASTKIRIPVTAKDYYYPFIVDCSFCTGPRQLLIRFFFFFFYCRLVYILHEWNRIVCMVVCLASFTQNKDFRDLTTLSLRISRLLQYMHYLYIYLLIDTAIQYFMWDSEISYKWLEKEILKIFFY